MGLRIIEHFIYNEVIVQKYREIYSDEREKPYLFSHNANIDVELKNSIYHFRMITNSEGLRERDDYHELPASVIFLGDSVVEGSSVENEETMSSVFTAVTGVKALNFGVGSSNTVQEYFFLLEKFKESYNPKLIILGFCLNDIEQNTYRRFFDPAYSNWQLYDLLGEDGELVQKTSFEKFKTWVKTFRILTVTKEILKKFKGHYKTEEKVQVTTSESKAVEADVDPMPNPHDLKITELYIKKIANFASENNSRFIVAMFPYESQLGKNYRTNGRVQDKLIESLDRMNIDYIDLYTPMKDAIRQSPNERWFHDNVHPYKIGHNFIGKYLADEVLRKGYLSE